VNKTFNLTVKPAPLLIATAPLPSGKVNQPYSASVTATGGTAPYLWSASKLPAGVLINAATGAISGTPTKPGTYSVKVSISDASRPVQTASTSLVVIVSG
jgi:hypothetical protein